MEYNKKFQAVLSLVLKAAGICIFLPKVSFDTYIFHWGKERGELLLCTPPLLLPNLPESDTTLEINPHHPDLQLSALM